MGRQGAFGGAAGVRSEGAKVMAEMGYGRRCRKCVGVVLAVTMAGLALAACGWFAPAAAPPAASPTVAATIALPPAAETPTSGPATSVPSTPFPTDLPLANVAYRIPLTLRHVTATSATLYFELDQPAQGRIVLVPEDAHAAVIEARLDATQARTLWTAEGLGPASRYTALVALDAPDGRLVQPRFQDRLWGPVHVRTVDESVPMRIGVIGDASFGDPGTIELVQQMAASGLDFVLHAGDVVDETDSGVDPFDSYARKFFTPFEPLLTQLPVYTVPGNHDRDGDIQYEGSGFYFHAFPAFADTAFPGQGEGERNQFYAFSRRSVQFVMLDSQVIFGVEGREAETAWLEERLADPRFAATIVVLHVAPFSSSSVHPDNSLPVRDAWVPLFANSHVRVVFSGHFHQYERLISQGVTYVVSGGGSSILYAPGEMMRQSQVFHRRTHFVLMEIDGQRIRLTAIALGGEILDTAEIPLVAPTS